MENAKISNFKILSKIGEGGMGIVYLAQDVNNSTKVAIKILNPELSDKPSIKGRFINEGIALSKLSHPNIVKLLKFLEKDNRLYLIMEFVEGETLENIIRKNNQPFEEGIFIPIFIKVLEAFSYAHEKGIIHRDIKPSNIMITKDLEPKILDFGIAKLLYSNVKITKTGSRLGTISYMSPEQVLGKQVDERSDIYSLGITLYEVLTGKYPYGDISSSEYDIMNKIVSEDIIPIDKYNISISKKINCVIQKATEKDPNDRFQTCDEFIQALRENDFEYIPIKKTKQTKNNFSFEFSHELFEVIYDLGKWIKFVSVYYIVLAGLIYFSALYFTFIYLPEGLLIGGGYILISTIFFFVPGILLSKNHKSIKNFYFKKNQVQMENIFYSSKKFWAFEGKVLILITLFYIFLLLIEILKLIKF